MNQPNSASTPLQWLSNLALEAPLVALFWWVLVNQTLREQPVDWQIGCALFFAVWAIYLVDRIFDRGLKLPNQPERKQFADRHVAWLIGLLFIAGVASVWFGVRLSTIIWWQAVAVGLLTAIYFALCRMISLQCRFPLKELLIGICFALAAGMPINGGEPITTWVSLLILGLLCTLNCLLVSRAESEFDQKDDPNAWFATRRKISFRYFWWAILVVIAGLLFFQKAPMPIMLALAIATLLLAQVDQRALKKPNTAAYVDACLWVAAITGLLLHLLCNR